MNELPLLPMSVFATGASHVEIILLAAAAFFIGLLAGMLGVAMGIIRLPLMLALGFSPLAAAGTNLGVSALGGIAGAWPHFRGGRVVLRVVVVFGLPAIVGSFLGAHFADRVHAWILLSIIGVILGTSSISMLLQVLKPRPRAPSSFASPRDPTGVANLTLKRFFVDGTVGLGIGLIGGAVGMVLGTLRLPALVNVLKMSPGRAAGTNNAIGVLAATFGFAGHAANGNFDLPVLLSMGVAGMVGSYIGAVQTGRVSARSLRLVIGVLLLSVTPIVLYRAVVEFPG